MVDLTVSISAIHFLPVNVSFISYKTIQRCSLIRIFYSSKRKGVSHWINRKVPMGGVMAFTANIFWLLI